MPHLKLAAYHVACAVLVAAAPPAAGGDSTFDCLIEPKANIKLGSQATGILEQVLVDRGDAVKAGAVVAVLESTIETRNAAIAHLRASNDTEVRLAQEAATFEGGRFDRRSTLWKTKTISEETLQKADTDARMRNIEVERARFALELARLEAGRVQALLDLRTIRSPVNGVIIGRKMSPGEFVRDESQIMEIAQIDPLHVHAFLPVAMFDRIRVGMAGVVRAEKAIGGEYRSSVTVKDPVVNGASGTFLVRLELANAQGRIPSGIRCQVSFGDR